MRLLACITDLCAAEARREARRRRERAAETAARRRYEAECARRRLVRAYGVCRRLAYLDYHAHCARSGIPVPVGRDWPHRPEHIRFKADWPYDPPEGWQPPPGVLERVVEPWTTVPYGYDEEAEVRPLVPPYVPGRPWPWLDNDGHGAEQARDGPPPTANCR
jgi:hypothetical protein